MKQSEEAYQKFKEAMLSGRIAPGVIITQSEVGKLLGVQISPLRVAINKLEAEGFVEVLSRSGIRIIKPDLYLIRNSFQLRSLIETSAIRSYVRQVTDADLATLRSRHENVLATARDAPIDAGVIDSIVALDAGMHNRFVAALDNPIIQNVYATNEERIKLIRRDRPNYLTSLVVRETLEEHLAIIAALEARNPDAAEAALSQHLSQSLRRAMGL